MMDFANEIFIENQKISLNSPTYFIADIAANHDSDLERAKNLIYLAKESGADAVKFQHFLAQKIVSDYGFQNLGQQSSHQSKWNKSVFEIFKQFECNREWTLELIDTAKKAGIHFFTTPYDFEAIDLMNKYIPAYKIGSGDISWINFIEEIAKLEKPVLLATGASDLEDVQRAIKSILKYNKQLVLMQCNTNYTGSLENFKYLNLNVLKTFSKLYPGIILGLSDHTPFHSSVLGAITLGARVIEKHFTDNNDNIGPDHPFSMNPKTWREMIDRARELQYALGDGIKKIEKNEETTAIIQRRCLRLAKNKMAGDIIDKDDIEILRPCPEGSFEPYEINKVIGKKLKNDKIAGDAIYHKDLGE